MTRLLSILGLCVMLAGCSDRVVYVEAPVPMQTDDKAMENCERKLKAQQEHNGLSPLCYCEWQEDSEFNESRGSFPKRYLNDTAIRCDTCDPFQQGYSCGDIPL